MLKNPSINNAIHPLLLIFFKVLLLNIKIYDNKKIDPRTILVPVKNMGVENSSNFLPIGKLRDHKKYNNDDKNIFGNIIFFSLFRQ